MGTCDKCCGLGYMVKVDIMSATNVKEPCADCRGTGQKLETVTTGARVGRVAGELWKFQDLVEGKVVAELLVMILPVIGEGGRPQVSGKTGTFNVYGQIMRLGMQVMRKYRRMGRMWHLMDFASRDPKLKWLECEWNYATEEGRSFLLKYGFEREGDALIWRPKE